MFAADKGVFARGLEHRYPLCECPGPSAPSAPNAGGLWPELPLALERVAGMAGFVGGAVPFEVVGELVVTGLGLVPEEGVPPEPVPATLPPPLPLRDEDDWRT